MTKNRACKVAAETGVDSAPARLAFFLQGGAGRLFCMHHLPGSETQVLVVPPFAEEMNKSRRMFTLLARSLVERNCGVLLPDLYGTGDSEGDFAHARWQIWKNDLQEAVRHLERSGATEVTLLGLRLGALLAMECVCEGRVSAVRAVLWQPVVSGSSYLTQFLRLRIAADMTAENKETTQALRQRLSAGESLEIAGYILAPELASAIDAASMQILAPPTSFPLHWMELASSLSPAGRAIAERWAARTSCVSGPPFWTTSEITLAPELIAGTATIFD
jgi:exosortase A-associated hydrolase 2